MTRRNVIDLEGRESSIDPLTELLRTGAHQLLQQAIGAELQELLSTHAERRLEDGRAGVVRNGFFPERQVQTGIGPVYLRCRPKPVNR